MSGPGGRGGLCRPHTKQSPGFDGPSLPFTSSGSTRSSCRTSPAWRRVRSPIRVSPAAAACSRPGGDVDGVTGHERLAAGGVARNHHSPLLTPVRASIRTPQSRSISSLRRSSASLSSAAAPDRPDGMVLVDDRDAEDSHHRIADELLDGSAVTLERARNHLEEADSTWRTVSGSCRSARPVESATSVNTIVTGDFRVPRYRSPAMRAPRAMRRMRPLEVGESTSPTDAHAGILWWLGARSSVCYRPAPPPCRAYDIPFGCSTSDARSSRTASPRFAAHPGREQSN